MEKTFEELIEEKFNPKNYSGFKPSAMADKGIKELMRQVREATKKEDAEIADKYKAPHIAEAILNTATDRIKLTENKDL